MLQLALALPFLSGCILDEEQLDASVPAAPAHFRTEAAPEAPPVSADWAKAFNSRELVSLVDAARAANFDIAAAVARIVQADAQARIAAAPLYPTLGGTAGASRTLSPGTIEKAPPFQSTISNLFSLGVNASYTLDFFGKNQAAAEAGRLTAEASRYDRDVVELTSVAAVATTYFTILEAQDRLRVAHANIAAAEGVLTAIKTRFEVGTAAALDVAQQQSLVAIQRAAVPNLEQSLQQSRAALAVLVGRTPESLDVRGGSLTRLAVPLVRPGLPSDLLLRRPDIASAEAQLAAEKASVAAARAAFFPTITLTSNVGVESLFLKTLLQPDAIAANAAAGLTQPIFDGGNLQGQLDLAKGHYSELLQDYRKTIVQALADVENALIAVQQTTSYEKLQSAAVAAARRAYQLTEQRLQEGTIDVVTLVTSEQTLFQAEDTLAVVRLSRLQAIVSLYQALGGGWSKDASAQYLPDAGSAQ
jgi:NodT family efflux transporter outer membrane factor (OMF) lipoprotein